MNETSYVSLTPEQKEKQLENKASYILTQKICEYESAGQYLSGKDKRRMKRSIKRKLK